jgi:hypothetical protein
LAWTSRARDATLRPPAFFVPLACLGPGDFAVAFFAVPVLAVAVFDVAFLAVAFFGVAGLAPVFLVVAFFGVAFFGVVFLAAGVRGDVFLGAGFLAVIVFFLFLALAAFGVVLRAVDDFDLAAAFPGAALREVAFRVAVLRVREGDLAAMGVGRGRQRTRTSSAAGRSLSWDRK